MRSPHCCRSTPKSIGRRVCSLGKTRQFIITLHTSHSPYHIYSLTYHKSTHQYTHHILLTIFLQLLQPLRDTLIRRPSGQVKHYQRTRSSFIVGMRNRPISLLTSRVPYLNFNSCSVDHYSLCRELYTYCGFRLDGELVSLKSR